MTEEKKVTKKQTADQLRISQLETELEMMKGALSKVATLTGYGNHLNEFNLDKWTPGKKDMGKKFAA